MAIAERGGDVHIYQARVDLRRTHKGVPQQRLYDSQVRAILKQMSCKTVSKNSGTNVFQADPLTNSSHQLPNRNSCERVSFPI